jgi:hypothetical protein
MAGVLRERGLLVLTSRNWERVRPGALSLRVADRLVERRDGRALVIHAWTIADGWADEHHLDVAVALVDGGGDVTTRSERLSFWPFRHQELDEDLCAAGLAPESTTYADGIDRYLVTARREMP